MQSYPMYSLMVLHQESGLGQLKAVFLLAMNWKELETWLGCALESRSIIHLWETLCVSIPLACFAALSQSKPSVMLSVYFTVTVIQIC